MTKDDALELTLHWFSKLLWFENDGIVQLGQVKKAIKKALAQPEPVALEEKFSLLLWDYQELERAFEKVTGGKWVRKSNTPQRTWVGLTDEEIKEIIGPYGDAPIKGYTRKLFDQIEAALRSKNT